MIPSLATAANLPFHCENIAYFPEREFVVPYARCMFADTVTIGMSPRTLSIPSGYAHDTALSPGTEQKSRHRRNLRGVPEPHF